ncbi:hypothetical protein ACFQWH_03005 [Mycolicibacterium sp. GCM10028919]|uniref:hypothetical protein n=1 Tax=Mycolicibacterium sp. GCM10028919 TaxID=3273401 RepID=UPI003613A9AB
MSRLCGVLAAAACILGVVLVTPAMSPTMSPMPSASAVPQPNGYDVNCTQSGGQVVCTIAGCPRVFEDLAGDVVHTKVNGGPQAELSKACGNTTTQTINTSEGFDYAVQGCRKSTFGSDDCGAWSNYTYTPPAAQTVKCNPAGNFEQAEVPAGQQCVPKKVSVKCPAGSPTPEAASLGQCAAVPPKTCPPGSATPDVPAGQQCQGPTNAVTLSITRQGLSANVAVTNKSALPAECAYTATRTAGVGPASVNRNISVGANSTGNITDVAWPLPLMSYRATVTCTATYDGKQVTIGESTQNVSG